MKGVNRLTRRDFLRLSGAGVAGAGVLALYGCGGGGGSSSGELNWASWANEGEAKRFKAYTEQFNKQHKDLTLTYTSTPSFDDYHPKILTQLQGGKGPDAFYLGDSAISTFIDNGTITQLNDFMTGQNSEAKPEEFSEGLWGPARLGEKIYGVTVDCNPTVIWYNKKVLSQAGIKEEPKDLYEAGEWKWDTFVEMCQKVTSGGNTNGFMFENANPWFYSWCRQNGGEPYDGETYVANQDAKSVEAFQWMADGLKNGYFTYAGNLPTGQASDAQFATGQAAFVEAGRWLLPNFRQTKGLEYDIVPFPTNTDNKMEPGWVATAYMAMNSQTQDEESAFEFLTNYTSPEGQKFRLSGGGNAVPSVQGADEVVLEGNNPVSAQYFLDVRDNGGIMGYPVELGVPGLTTDMQDILAKRLWEEDGKGDVQAALDEVAELANQKIKEQKNEG